MMKTLITTLMLAMAAAASADLRSPSGTVEGQPWSEAVHGLRARLSMEREKDSPFVKVFLELQNTSGVAGIKSVRFTPDSMTTEVTTEAGKALQKAGGDYDGMTPDWTPLKLPYEGTLRFRISFPGQGFNPNTDKTLVDLGFPYSWSIPEGEACYLSAKLKIDKEDGDHPHMDWSGTLSLPKVLIPQMANEPDFSKRKSPAISIKTAIAKAEAYIKEEKLKTEGKHLARVQYHESGPWTEPNPANKTSGPYWQITYELDTKADGGQIFVLIYMDGKARHVGGR